MLAPGQNTRNPPQRAPGLWGKLLFEGDRATAAARRNASIEAAHARLAEARKQQAEIRAKHEQVGGCRSPTQGSPGTPNTPLAAGHDGPGDGDRPAEAAGAGAAQEGRAGRRACGHLPVAGAPRGPGGGALQAGRAHPGPIVQDRLATQDEEEAEDGEDLRAAGAPEAPDHPDYHGRGWRKQRQEPPGEVWEEEEERGQADDDDDDVAMQPLVVRPLPPPRPANEPVKISFTPTEIPHLPAREKREASAPLFLGGGPLIHTGRQGGRPPPLVL